MDFNLRSLKTSFFLALRYIKQTNPWTTFLVIFVMILTFLNLVVINGILVGLIEGSLQGWRENYSGDVIITTPNEQIYIENTQKIISVLDNLPEVEAYSPRFLGTAYIEEDFQRREEGRNREDSTVSATLYGIDVEKESQVTGLHTKAIEGEFLTPDDTTSIVIGANLLERYFPRLELLNLLKDVHVGDSVLLTVGGTDEPQRFFVKGVLKTKTDNPDFGIFINGDILRKYTGRFDYNVGEIAIKASDNVSPEELKAKIISNNVSEYGNVQTYYDAIGKFLDDIKQTFSLLGTIIGVIGLIVASITVFIVIFIMLVTRQRFIGILKAIGIGGNIITSSYVMLSFFFATLGSIVGSLLTFGLIKPYFDKNPIDFPFSEGILFISTNDFIISMILLFIATLLAGFIPAKLIVKRNTLDLMLGR